MHLYHFFCAKLLTSLPVYISLALIYFQNKRTQYFQTTLKSQVGGIFKQNSCRRVIVQKRLKTTDHC